MLCCAAGGQMQPSWTPRRSPRSAFLVSAGSAPGCREGRSIQYSKNLLMRPCSSDIVAFNHGTSKRLNLVNFIRNRLIRMRRLQRLDSLPRDILSDAENLTSHLADFFHLPRLTDSWPCHVSGQELSDPWGREAALGVIPGTRIASGAGGEDGFLDRWQG